MEVRQYLSILVLLLFLMFDWSAVTTSVWGLLIHSVTCKQSIWLSSSLQWRCISPIEKSYKLAVLVCTPSKIWTSYLLLMVVLYNLLRLAPRCFTSPLVLMLKNGLSTTVFILIRVLNGANLQNTNAQPLCQQCSTLELPTLSMHILDSKPDTAMLIPLAD